VIIISEKGIIPVQHGLVGLIMGVVLKHILNEQCGRHLCTTRFKKKVYTFTRNVARLTHRLRE